MAATLLQAGPVLHGAETAGDADVSGLICGYVFSPGTQTRAIDIPAALHWLQSARETDSREFVWLHFSRSNANAEKWMRSHLALPDHYFETLLEGPGSTRIEQADNCLIAVVNDVIYDFSYDASQIATLWMCVDNRLVVSTRLHPLRSIDRLRVSVKGGEQFESPVSLLSHLLRDQADVLQQIEREASLRVDDIEDTLLAGRMDVKRGTLGALRRVFVRLRRLLAPEPGALFRLLSRPPSWFNEHDAQEFRAATEEFSAVLNDLTALQERTKLLQEEIVAHTTEQTNRSVFMLTVVTVLALPINIIAGLLGMNVGGIPLAQNPHGFWVIAAIVATFTAIAGWYVFLKRRD
ncbi:MAG: transporter [Sulfuriferula sp.]|nr:transporter [Sulfuriferula sp.]